MAINTHQQSVGDIAVALGGKRNGEGWICHCPVPSHGKGRGDRFPSLSLHEGEDGRLLAHCFGGCDFATIIGTLNRLGLTVPRNRARPLFRPVLVRQREHDPDQEAVMIWHGAESARGTVVQEYLERRGIITLPPTLRFGYFMHLGRYQMPCMIAAVQRPDDGKVIAVQRTVLSSRAEKAAIATPKITTGALGLGAVRLAAAAEVMGLAEGVETGLSAQFMSDVPVWCSLGCQRLDRVELPAIVKTVHIFGDNDPPGRVAADRTAAVHRNLGRNVVIHFPPDGIKDFNDLLNADADDALRDLKTSVADVAA